MRKAVAKRAKRAARSESRRITVRVTLRISTRLSGANCHCRTRTHSSSSRLVDLNLREGSAFVYAYDMGDGWEHDIVVRAIEPMAIDGEPDRLAYVVGGGRAAPPEDVGGPAGYERLILASHRRSSADDMDLIAWVGAGFEPEVFDLRASNHALVLATAWGVI